jgi:hypothetical protein
MSGIVSGMNYNLLFSGETSSVATAAILTALYSNSATPTTTFVSSGNPVTDVKLAQQEQTTGVAQEALQPQVADAITAFKTAVTNAKTIQDALGNPNVQKVLLTASGLSSYIGDTALVQKMLMSDLTDPKSLVNQFGDATWLSTVETYNFAQNGLSELQNPKIVSTLSNAYAEVQWRTSLDQATPGLSNALTFLSQASSIKSVNDILDNITNYEVIAGALGIPLQIVNQDTSAQVSAITSRLDISKLQDRSYVTNLTDQYLLTMQENNASSSGSGTNLETLAIQAQGILA